MQTDSQHVAVSLNESATECQLVVFRLYPYRTGRMLRNFSVYVDSNRYVISDSLSQFTAVLPGTHCV